MGDQRPHTLSALEGELQELSAAVAHMGDAVCEQLTHLLDALRHLDVAALSDVIDGDARIDMLHSELDLRIVGLLARNQPVARDLREVLAAQRVGLELERTGDHVKRIAKHLLSIQPSLPAEITGRLLWFGGQAQALLQRALWTYEHLESDQVERTWADDAQLDQMYHGLLAELLGRMRQQSEWVAAGVSLVMAAKSLERIGDHATNIAEEAQFVALGETLQGRRRPAS